MRKITLVAIALAAACRPVGGGMAQDAVYDYVVVGAGSAGCVIASRLSEDPAARVLLLEAGEEDLDPRIREPASYRSLSQGALNWGYSTEPDAALGLSAIPFPAGKVWGGGSSISAMVYVRGAAADYDGWEKAGLRGWGFEKLLPYFRKSENQERGPSRYHGTGGPLNVADPRYVAPIARAFLQAAGQTGVLPNEDFNGARADGAGLFQVNQKIGERHSAASAFLRPALRRANLRVESRALVTRLVIEKRRAVGVEYARDGSSVRVRAAREVILCAGSLGSPKLLMLSGIGPAAHLRANGIPVLIELQGVGENLQDHPRVAATYRSLRPLGFADEQERESAIRQYREQRTGPMTSAGPAAGAFVKLSADSTAPDLLLYLSIAENTFSINAVLLHPRSRGKVELRSALAEDPPVIHPRYLAEPADMETLVRGLQWARRIARAGALREYRGDEIFPGDKIATEKELISVLREQVLTFFHPVGTCRMGTDSQAVVDERLRVRGVEGLRVIDASVMPVLVGAPTLPATLAIAERGADLLKGR